MVVKDKSKKGMLSSIGEYIIASSKVPKKKVSNVPKNPFRKVARPSMFDYGTYFKEGTTLRTIFDSTYAGSTDEEKANQRARNANNPLFLRSSKAKLRSLFIKSFGVDPFAPGFRWDKTVDVVRGTLGQRARAVTLGGLTMKQARERWAVEKKQQVASGRIMVDGKWVRDSPEMRARRLQMSMARRAPEADDGSEGWIAYDEAKKVFPAYDRTFLRYIRRHKGHVPGIPYKMLMGMARQAAYASVLADFRKKKYRGMTLQQYWDYSKRTDEDIAHGKVGESDVVPADPAPGPLLDRLLAKKKKYEQDRLDFFKKNQHKIGWYEKKILERKGLAPKPKPVVTMIGTTSHNKGARVSVKKGGSLYRGLIKAGWVEMTQEQFRQQGIVQARKLTPWVTPKMMVRAQERARPYLDRFPELKREALYPPEVRKALGSEIDQWFDAVAWMQEHGYADFFGRMAKLRPSKSALQHMRDWWIAHKGAIKYPPKAKVFAEAHLLGPYGFGKWYAKEGFSSADDFTDALRKTILPNRLAKLKKLMDSKDTSPEQYSKLWQRYWGIKAALRMAKTHDREKTGGLKTPMRTLPTHGYNSLGIYGKIRAGDYLRAAYYDRFYKTRIPGGKKRMGHKGRFPASSWKTVPAIREFTGLWGEPRYYKIDTDPGAYGTAYGGGLSGKEVIAPSWGEALARGLESRDTAMDWRIRAAGYDSARRSKIRNPLDLLLAMGEGAGAVALRIGGLAAGFVEGAGQYIGQSLGAWRSGVPIQKMRWLTRLSPKNLSAFMHHASGFKGNLRWKKYASGEWSMAIRTAEQQTAAMFDEHIRSKLGKDVLTNTVGNAADIIVALASLPGIVLGPQFEDLLKTGPDMLTRMQRAVEFGKGFGKQMGYGFGKFIKMVATDPVKMFKAAPIDTLIMWYPLLRTLRRSAQYGRMGPKKRAVVDFLYARSKKLFDLVDSRLAGGRMLKMWTRANKMGSKALYATLRKLGPAGDIIMNWRSKARTAMDEPFLMRTSSERAFYASLFEKIGGEVGLRQIGSFLERFAKKGDPHATLELVDALRRSLPEGVLKKTPKLLSALEVAEATAREIASVSGIAMPRKKWRFLGLKRLVGTKFKGLLQSFEESIRPGVQAKVLRQIGSDLADYLGPTTATLEYGGRAVKGQARSFRFYPRWRAIDWVQKLITQPKWNGFISDKLNANPVGLIAELKRLRGRISSGADFTGTKWLFGVDLKAGALTNKNLGMLKLHFGWLDDASGKRLPQLGKLGARLKNEAVRQRVIAGIDGLIARVGDFQHIDWKILTKLGLTPEHFQFRFFKRKEFKGLLPTHQPGIFVPKQFNKQLVSHFEKGLETPPPVMGLEKAVVDMTGNQLRLLVKQINDAIKSEYKHLPQKKLSNMLIKVGQDVSKADLQQIVLRLRGMVSTGMPKPLAAFVEKIYGISGDRFTKIINAAREAAANRMTKFQETFIANLETHGPLEALQRLFGRKLYSKNIALKDIAGIPSVLRFLPNTSKGAKALEELKRWALTAVIDKKKALVDVFEPLRRHLGNATLRIEGGQVRTYWEANSPVEGSMSKKVLASPDKRPGFLQTMVEGKIPKDLPAALRRLPELIIADLQSIKSVLLKQALGAGVSKQKFLYAFEGTMRRLRRYGKVPEGYRLAFGLTGKEIIYVPRQVLSGVKYMKMAQEQLGPVVSFFKRNFTSRNFITFMNNLQSSIMLQATRVGRVENPFRQKEVIGALAALKSPNKKQRLAGSTLIERLIKEGKLKREDLLVYRDIVDVPKFLEMGAFEIEMGGLRGLSKSNPLKMLENAYSYTDKGFKFHDAVRGHRWMSHGWNLEKIGNTVRFERSPGVIVTVEKVKNLAQTKVGRERLVGWVIGPDGKTRTGITGSELSQMFAKGSAAMADRAFVNYGSVAKALSIMRSKGLNAIGIFAPFLTWAWKATYIPGIKSGIPQMMFRPHPYMTFSGKLARASAAADAQAAALRATLLVQMGRQQLMALPEEDLRNVLEYIPGEMKPMLIQMMSDADVLGTKDLGWMSFLGPTQLLFGLVKSLAIDPIKKAKLLGEDNALFESHWLGPKNKTTGKQRLLFNLKGPAAVEAGYATADGKLTAKGQEILRLRKWILKQAAMPSGRRIWNVAEVLLMTGGVGRAVVDILVQASKPNSREFRIVPKLIRAAMTMGLGGTVTAIADVAAGYSDKKSIFSSKSDDPITERVEGMLRFAIKRISGLGVRVHRTDLASERHFRRLQTSWRTVFLGAKDKKDSIIWGISRSESKIKILKKKLGAITTKIQSASVSPVFMKSDKRETLIRERNSIKGQLDAQKSSFKRLSRKKASIDKILKSEMVLYKRRIAGMWKLVDAARRKRRGGATRQPRLPFKRKGEPTAVERLFMMGPTPDMKIVMPEPKKKPKKKAK